MRAPTGVKLEYAAPPKKMRKLNTLILKKDKYRSAVQSGGSLYDEDGNQVSGKEDMHVVYNRLPGL